MPSQQPFLLIVTVVVNRFAPHCCDWMTFTSGQIDDLMNTAQCKWHCPIRLQITAGVGCTVLEFFDRDAHELSIPLQRALVSKPFAIEV